MSISIKSDRKISIIAGVLIILGMVAGILSIIPSVEGIDYLTAVSSNKNQLLSGALFQLFLVPIYLGFALILYPILKKYKGNLALGFVGFRIIAAVFQIIGVVLLPMFLLLSQGFLKSKTLDIPYFETLGELLKLGRDLVNHLGVMLATGFGNLLLYYMFYKTKLVPKWLSVWGLLANMLAMLTSFLILFGSISVVSIMFVIMTVPLVVQEIVLSIWLIVKGFDTRIVEANSIG